MSDLECKVCGQPASVHTVTTPIVAEPEAAKVIVVVEAPAGDRSPVERRYLAHEADDHRDYGVLRIRRDDRVIAGYSQGQWASFHEEGATVPDATARALGIAKRALGRIAATILERDDERREVVASARDALEEIFAETE